MGVFGCTQIRTSSSCSSERKKDANNLFFFGSEYFAQRFNQHVDENGQKKLPITQVTVLADFWGCRREYGGIFDSNVPRHC